MARGSSDGTSGRRGRLPGLPPPGVLWLLAPIVIAALVVGLLVLLRRADGVPFVYTLF